MKSVFIFSDNQKDNISYYERDPAIVVLLNRDDLPYLKEQEFADFAAIYVLIGGEKRYIGQAAGQTIAQRLSQHFATQNKAWVESVLFFSRTDGKLSKADTDYLERRLIQDFQEKSDYHLTNSTVGNHSYIGKLQQAQSNQLYNTVFEIIDQIANIDLFGASTEARAETGRISDEFSLTYDNKTVVARSARRLFVEFVKSVFKNPRYQDEITGLVIDTEPTSVFLFGKKAPSRNLGEQIFDGIWLYTNFSRKDLHRKLTDLARKLGINIQLQWAVADKRIDKK